jgi:hypothetical protein
MRFNRTQHRVEMRVISPLIRPGHGFKYDVKPSPNRQLLKSQYFQILGLFQTLFTALSIMIEEIFRLLDYRVRLQKSADVQKSRLYSALLYLFSSSFILSSISSNKTIERNILSNRYIIKIKPVFV